MTREQIKERWPILGHFATLKKTSRDPTNNQYMTESTIDVIDFDKIPKEFARGKGWPGVPKSNDALYIDSSVWTFIEFKNGHIDKADVYRKIYDSIIMLLELKIVPDVDFVRKHIRYILVCKKTQVQPAQESENRTTIYSHIKNRANAETVLFELDKLQGYLLAEVHTYSPEEFEAKFVRKYTSLTTAGTDAQNCS